MTAHPPRPASRLSAALAALAALWSLAAACSATYDAVRRSDPPALDGVQRVAVSSDASQATLDGVPVAAVAWPEGKSWEALDVAVREALAASLDEALGDVAVQVADPTAAAGEATLVVRYGALEAGRSGPFGAPTVLAAELTFEVAGAETDALRVAVSTPPSIYRPTLVARLRHASAAAARQAAAFIRDAQRAGTPAVAPSE